MDKNPRPGVFDPICGLSVDPAKTRFVHRRQGRDYYFCCQECLQAFKKRDEKRGLTAVDPICGMTVKTDETEYFCTKGDREYFFCSQGCLKAFEKKASRLLKTKGAFGRWLERLERANAEMFGFGPKCH